MDSVTTINDCIETDIIPLQGFIFFKRASHNSCLLHNNCERRKYKYRMYAMQIHTFS